MGILDSIKTMLGITLMKTDKALRDSIDEVDKMNLAINNEKEQLKKANEALKETRVRHKLDKKAIEDAQTSLKELEQKAYTMVENYRRKGLSDDEIAAKVATVSDSMTRDIERLKNIITSKTPIVESLAKSIVAFEQKISSIESTIRNNESQAAMLATNIEVAKTSKMIANTSAAMNESSSTATIANAKQVVNRLEAEAQAMLEQAEFQGSSEDKLDKLLAESARGDVENNPFAKALAGNKQAQIENK